MSTTSNGIMVRYAEDLSEVYQHIRAIGKEIEQADRNSNVSMWFRGHTNASYHLEPSIFRDADYHYNQKETYSNNHLREEYRFQSFMSRNYDNVDYRMPQTMIEWQEVMQHFFAKTRLMDWSESLIIALEFALEPFITPVKDLEVKEKCRTAEPTIWILQPKKLNKAVYQSFIEENENKGKGLIQKAVTVRIENKSNLDKKRLVNEIWEELSREASHGTYYDIGNEKDENMNAMIGLSSLEIIRTAYKARENEALKAFEINPFFYLLLRYYSDGIPVHIDSLPPLAIIHPYHSQRIRLQKGVFTVFPYYIPGKQMELIKETTKSYPSFGMEYMKNCIPCLHCIRILNPEKVAKELRQTGARRSNIYPEMQIVSQDIENVSK